VAEIGRNLSVSFVWGTLFCGMCCYGLHCMGRGSKWLSLGWHWFFSSFTRAAGVCIRYYVWITVTSCGFEATVRFCSSLL